MITKAELNKKSNEWGIRFDIVEKDFCIGWLLKGIANDSNFKNNLTFKGGTALRKCYFHDYRFSEDLDFTGKNELKRNELESKFSEICQTVSDESGCEFELISFSEIRSVLEQEAYEGKISFRGPTQPQNLKPVIKIDLTFYEQTLELPQRRKIIHPYSDTFETHVLVYSLEEILGEKLRALIQQKNRVPRPRDYYDIWSLLRNKTYPINIKKVSEIFKSKCQFKKVAFNSTDDFFDEKMLQKNRHAWDASIGKQVPNLIDFDDLVADLKHELKKLVS